jgi:hypothetical protein
VELGAKQWWKSWLSSAHLQPYVDFRQEAQALACSLCLSDLQS